ncbi:hypothetical protein FEE95_20410 [Maribacter algarum]|uniref:Uncharacterized protein n=1 Tax=Maribacter algarum (ex Zhang et al. 2020) TaxID=2578118 RepID=A0A5S3PH09_9FLAO|nr:BfmA/BtgA family mobilization protein [Maribacter algarum]TMM53423.1 hypothetical protein FEE95_20410 [Maribacter algarum]
MKEKRKYKYPYSAISIRFAVALRFRVFSKKVARSHAETLTAMMDFFEWHNYSPHQRFGKDIIAGQDKNRKRIEAGIAISKAIEKSLNIPLMNIEMMLKSLFQEDYKRYVPKIFEPKKTDSDSMETIRIKAVKLKMKYHRANQKLEETQDRMKYLLDKIELVKNRFGKDYLKIEITREEVARFKRGLKDS